MEKYVDPHSGARATVLNETDIIYRVNIRQVMAWEYGSMDTRTDWRFDEAGGR
jgi:radical SAM superfamily enzyme with C-terminal helix-hairpin-helix motif